MPEIADRCYLVMLIYYISWRIMFHGKDSKRTWSPSEQLKLHPGEVFVLCMSEEVMCLQSDVLTHFTLSSSAKSVELHSATNETTASGKIVITFTTTCQFRIYCLQLFWIIGTAKSAVLQLNINFKIFK